MHELARLEQVVVVETVAATFEQPAVGREDVHLLARSILFGLPEGLELVPGGLCRLLLLAPLFLLFVLLELHIRERLRQIEMDLVNVLDGVGVLDIPVLRVQLIYSVKDQVQKAAVVGRVATLAARRGGSGQHVHQRLHDPANLPLPVGGDGDETEVVRELDETFYYFGPQYIVALLEVVPGAYSSVQVHDQNGIASPVLGQGALPRQVEASAPCEL